MLFSNIAVCVSQQLEEQVLLAKEPLSFSFDKVWWNMLYRYSRLLCTRILVPGNGPVLYCRGMCLFPVNIPGALEQYSLPHHSGVATALLALFSSVSPYSSMLCLLPIWRPDPQDFCICGCYSSIGKRNISQPYLTTFGLCIQVTPSHTLFLA